jgi:DNA-binding XRE family transcriptional regulator
MTNKTLPENPIIKVRKELGKRVHQDIISQGELSELAGISLNTIYNVEAGRVAKTNKKLLDCLVELGFDIQKLQQDYFAWREKARKQKMDRFRQ